MVMYFGKSDNPSILHFYRIEYISNVPPSKLDPKLHPCCTRSTLLLINKAGTYATRTLVFYVGKTMGGLPSKADMQI